MGCHEDGAAVGTAVKWAAKRATHLNILYSWELPQPPTKKLTANRFQFLGIMTKEYLDQMSPKTHNKMRHRIIILSNMTLNTIHFFKSHRSF